MQKEDKYNLKNTFPKKRGGTKRNRLLHNSFNDENISSIAKHDHGRQKKKLETKALININAKILDKILANLTQQCIKNVLHHDQLGYLELFKIELCFPNGTLTCHIEKRLTCRRGRRWENS